MTLERGGNDETVITLRAMQFNARVGILAAEVDTPQLIEVDLVLGVARASGKIDTTNILDYRHGYDLVAGILGEEHIPYLEEVAERIAAATLRLPLVRDVRVAVRKPNVKLSGPLAYAEVAVERRRD